MRKNIRLSTRLVKEAKGLLDARENCRLIHAAGNIDASGNEIEKPCRDFLRGWLSKSLSVTHGQIIDQTLKVSDQLDVVIADKLAAPPLYTSQDGTQYVPFESVYAVGELKSTYELAGIRSFCRKLRKLREDLHRKTIAGDEIQIGDTTLSGFRFPKPRPPWNQLFSFYLAVGAESDILETKAARNLSQLLNREWPDVPSAILILSQFALTPMNIKIEDGKIAGSEPLILPTFTEFFASDDSYNPYWTTLAMKRMNIEQRAALNLGLLLNTLSTHIRNSRLSPAPLFEYFRHSIDLSPSDLVVLAPIVKADHEQNKQEES